MSIDMIPPRQKGRPPEERFFDFCMPEPNSGCWLWIGGTSTSGYGRFYNQQAHRVSWEIHNGEIPEGLFACHKCDVRCRVNPEHLFLGTQSDNLRDMVSKGRDRPPRGEDQHFARLTEEQVDAIRKDPRRLRVIGEEYGVDRSYIWKIKRAWHWKHSHVENPEELGRRERGHAFKSRGESHPKAKLTEQDVVKIRSDPRSGKQIADEYGVAKHTVQCVKRRTIWKHVK